MISFFFSIESNNFTCFKNNHIESEKVIEFFSENLSTRGLSQFRWLNDSTVIGQEEYFKENDGLGTRYSKIHLRFNYAD